MIQTKIVPNLTWLLNAVATAKREWSAPTASVTANATQFQSTPSLTLANHDKKMAEIKEGLAQALKQPEPQVAEQLAKLNSKRSAQGKAPVDWGNTVQQLESIRKGPGTDKEKKERIEQLRKQMGLSKGEMKKLFTKPLAKIHQDAAKKLESYQKLKQTEFAHQIQQAEQSYGKNSPQVLALKSAQDSVLRSVETERNQQQQEAGFYKKLYPSFWSKLGSALKKIGGGILKVVKSMRDVLKKIPVIGSMVRIADNVLSPLKKLFTGKIGGFFKDLGKGLLKSVGDAKELLPLIPGIGPVASMVASGVSGLVSKLRPNG